MTPKDPFAPPDSEPTEHTLIKPIPGGQMPAPGQRLPSQPPRAAVARAIEMPARSGLNPMENAASAVLGLVVQLKSSTTSPDLAALRTQVNRNFQDLESKLLQLGYDNKTTKAAHYASCSLLDEVILGTPWGGQSDWRSNSLLSSFHRDTWGGDQFFTILENASQNPGGNLDLLEYLYLCLALGFEGKYGPLPNGAEQLAQVRENLYQLIRSHRPEFERELSPSWRPPKIRASRLARYIPLWALAALAAGILALAYTGYRFSLGSKSDPLMSAIYKLDGSDLAELNEPVRAPTQRSRDTSLSIRQLLAPEVAAGLVYLSESGNSVTISVVGDGMFASGRDRISPQYEGILTKIGEALAEAPGAVLITGHTDNVPIRRSVRFPSNWDLSNARAESVRELLVGLIGSPARFAAQGRADTEPVESNDTAEGRARNRRVEITLSPQRGSRTARSIEAASDADEMVGSDAESNR